MVRDHVASHFDQLFIVLGRKNLFPGFLLRTIPVGSSGIFPLTIKSWMTVMDAMVHGQSKLTIDCTFNMSSYLARLQNIQKNNEEDCY